MKYGHYTIEPANSAYGEESAVVVYGWGRYGRSSVLSGQRKKVILINMNPPPRHCNFIPTRKFWSILPRRVILLIICQIVQTTINF